MTGNCKLTATGIILAASLLGMPAYAVVKPTDVDACFNYSTTAFAHDNKIMSIFNNSNSDENSAVVEKYDKKIGTQMISTVVSAEIKSSDGKLNGRFVCLLSGPAEPVFLYYLPNLPQ